MSHRPILKILSDYEKRRHDCGAFLFLPIC